MVKSCSDSDAVAGSNLLRMYEETAVVTEALRVFDEMSDKDSMAWNVLLFSCSELGMGELCLQLFQRMVGDGVEVDEFTFAIVPNEMAVGLRINEGLQVHSMLVRSGICSDRYTCNALLNLYSKCGFIGSATIMFDEIHDCDVVSWTLMITGLGECGMQEEAFEALGRMRVVGEKPNSFTFGSLIGSCARASLLGMRKQCHAFVAKTGLDLDVVVGSAMVDMYSKCGGLKDAVVLFKNLCNRDIVSWNAMICGLAWNGESLKL
ncbi:hypothetical protein HPP92_018845 [Vanilla planifolia]|uniref:Pentatricopeptide repeat-containing protein n=1 Tax=Vanilla planifolia TaxID=51239 RepID=A0A835UMD3_VANPL|nr:hypothetical protein HPP92_018845 [Vanilla planifolia]